METVVLDTKDFGLPQRRSRIFIVCSRKELDIELSSEKIIENFMMIKKHSLCMYNSVLNILEKQVDKNIIFQRKSNILFWPMDQKTSSQSLR